MGFYQQLLKSFFLEIRGYVDFKQYLPPKIYVNKQIQGYFLYKIEELVF